MFLKWNCSIFKTRALYLDVWLCELLIFAKVLGIVPADNSWKLPRLQCDPLGRLGLSKLCPLKVLLFATAQLRFVILIL